MFKNFPRMLVYNFIQSDFSEYVRFFSLSIFEEIIAPCRVYKLLLNSSSDLLVAAIILAYN